MAALDVVRLLQTMPQATRLLATVQRAAQGDPEALAYLRGAGWQEALDLVRPGAGRAGRQVLQALRELASSNVVDGEFREVDPGPAPWAGFLRWLQGRTSGAFVILGPRGQGKTTLALRLAQVWARETGYRVEGLNLYDCPGFVQPINERILARRMQVLKAALQGALANDEPGDEDEAVEIADPSAALARMQGRILIIDEASLVIGSSGMDQGRRLVRQAMAQCRHLHWLSLFIGQYAQQLPLDVLLTDATFVKRPGGAEAALDRQHPYVQALWERAGESFKGIRSNPWWAAYPHPQAWTYVDCPDAGHGRPYRGLMPFREPDAESGEVA
ncbi:MAG: hypothetical protein HY690_09135 [Chloroflexi bacterium]|nr:hypothetical protein [Chloroflexota bacterium]